MNGDNPTPQLKQQLQQEIQRFTSESPAVREVDLMCMDIPGHFFGKRYPIAQLEKLAADGVKLPRSLPLVGASGDPITVGKYGLEDGDPDQTFSLIPDTLTQIPWDPTPRAQMMVSTAATETPLVFEPRAVLARVLEHFKQQGYFPTVAFELEFYLVDSQRNESGLIAPAKVSQNGVRDTSALLRMDRVNDFDACLSEIITACEAQGIITGALSAEMGPGQYELNLEHQADVMLAADQCAAFRRTVKAVARKHGHQATFMAKPYLEEAGNGQHLHLSLYDAEGNNVLQAKEDTRLRHAIAGSLEVLPASMAILAPNINAYRRYESGNCVAVNASWGYENRTVAVRVPDSDAKNRRLEHRVAGADSNPYLTLAVILAGMAHGLDQQQEPTAPIEGNAGDSDSPSDLPTHLRAALELFSQSAPLRQYLGEHFVDVYYTQKSSELAEFERLISAREYDWYL